MASSRYTVATADGDEDVHVGRLKPFFPDMKGKVLPYHYFRSRRERESQSDKWIVDEILDHRRHKGVLQWKVKWKGFDKPTWQPAKDFVGDIQSDWMEYNKKRGLNLDFSSLLLIQIHHCLLSAVSK